MVGNLEAKNNYIFRGIVINSFSILLPTECLVSSLNLLRGALISENPGVDKNLIWLMPNDAPPIFSDGISRQLSIIFHGKYITQTSIYA